MRNKQTIATTANVKGEIPEIYITHEGTRFLLSVDDEGRVRTLVPEEGDCPDFAVVCDDCHRIIGSEDDFDGGSCDGYREVRCDACLDECECWACDREAREAAREMWDDIRFEMSRGN